MGPETSGGKRGRVAIVVAPVATLIACSVLFLNLVTFAGDVLPDPADGYGLTADGGPWSSLEVRTSDLGDAWANHPAHNATHTYHVVHNVKAHRENLVFFVDEQSGTEVDLKDKTQLPLNWGKDRPSGSITLSRENATAESNPLRTCSSWVNKPAIRFYFSSHENLFHYLNDALLLVLDTLNDTGLTPPAVQRAMDAARRRDPSVKTCLLPETTDIMLVSPPEAMRFPWRFLFDLLSLEHRTPYEVNGRCFRTMIVGNSYEMDFRYKTPSQARGLRDFQAYAMRAALTRRVQGMPAAPAAARYEVARRECAFLAAAGQVPAPGSWRSGGALPRVTFAVRPPPAKRALHNEDAIVAAIRELYEVDLVLTKFDADDMYDTMKLVQSTDLFMGMHGAGFTNLLFMNPGAHVLQLFPFGWIKADGTPHREDIYLNMVEAANCSYTRWVSKRWDHAYLRREDHEFDNTTEPWKEHPDPAMIDPNFGMWQSTQQFANQGTQVDMDDFLPALKEAFERAGIPLRTGAADTAGAAVIRTGAQQ